MAVKKQEEAKKAAGRAAADLIQEGMQVGLGTGSTVFYLIKELGRRCREGLKVRAAASSKETERLAREEEIPLLDTDSITSLDLAVDGADEIDPKKRMIKGGGGALLREKILAFMSAELVVIVDPSKQTPLLGRHPLPVEIAPFAKQATLHRLNLLGYRALLRRNGSGSAYVTDNGNCIADLHFPSPLESPEAHDEILRKVPGVLETGFFFGLAGRVIVGESDGKTSIL